MKIAVVTGASSGIGAEFVRQIATKYKTLDEIWVLARRKEALEALSKEVSIPIRVFSCDLTKKSTLRAYKTALEKKKPFVRVLVNAAGYGIIGQFDEMTDNDVTGMCDLNCLALTRMIAITKPYMVGKRANLINIASSAAFLPQPSFAVYAATKSYVLSISRALHKEFLKDGIFVTAVCPGPVDTEFFERAEIYHKTPKYKKAFRADKSAVVSLALQDAFHGRSVSVCNASMKAFRILAKFMPHSLLIHFIN